MERLSMKGFEWLFEFDGGDGKEVRSCPPFLGLEAGEVLRRALQL